MLLKAKFAGHLLRFISHRFSSIPPNIDPEQKDLKPMSPKPIPEPTRLPLDPPLSFNARHRTSLAIFSLSAIALFSGHYFIAGFGTLLGAAESFRKENGFLRVYKLYIDLNSRADIRKDNLNGLIREQLMKNEYFKQFFTDEQTITFSSGRLERNFDEGSLRKFANSTETIERMQKKYKYMVDFIDLSKGTLGQVFADCIYNHDEDFYLKRVVIMMMKPKKEKILLLDKNEMIDL